MNPTLLVVLMVVAGVGCIVASTFVPADLRGEVIGAGMFLLGWALRRPGDRQRLPHPDDLL